MDYSARSSRGDARLDIGVVVMCAVNPSRVVFMIFTWTGVKQRQDDDLRHRRVHGTRNAF